MRAKGTYSKIESFETDWPEELLLSLVRLKREWFVDSYQRFEHPNYVQKQIDLCLELYNLRLGEGPVLDFGCGFGASSYCMARRGATNIVASDLEKPNTNFASQFFAARELSSRVTIFSGDITPSLKPASFSVIWLQAVMEHLLPEERQSYLRIFWKALMPGGILIITETPNRVWPIEGHTTGGTWWLPWMKPQTVFFHVVARRENTAIIRMSIFTAAESSALPIAKFSIAWAAPAIASSFPFPSAVISKFYMLTPCVNPPPAPPPSPRSGSPNRSYAVCFAARPAPICPSLIIWFSRSAELPARVLARPDPRTSFQHAAHLPPTHAHWTIGVSDPPITATLIPSRKRIRNLGEPLPSSPRFLFRSDIRIH